jgi:UDP:flavonoid glycosyltransferase YjiC (YdhE family)
MRVLFTTWAWSSHLYPMVPLAWALRGAGHEVLLTSQPDLTSTMVQTGLPAIAVGRDVDVPSIHRRDLGRLDVPSEPNGGAVVGQVHALNSYALFAEIAEAMAEDLLRLGRTWHPDLLVYDPLTYAGPLVARLLGVPAVRHLFGPDVTYVARALEEPALHGILARYGAADLETAGDVTVDPCPPSLQFPDVVAPVRRLRTRYVPYNGISEVPGWLACGARPRVCLTWGTSVARLVGDTAFIPAPVLAGCVRWAQESGGELVVAVASGQRHLLPDLAPQVRVAESVPLQALLPTCAALVHQGGAGSLFSAIWAQVPQLIVPQLPDQVVNGNHLGAAGAAAMLYGHTDADAVAQALGHLVAEPTYRAATTCLRDEILAQPPASQIIPALRDLARA